MRRITQKFLPLIFAVAACSDFPDLDAPGLANAARAPYPRFIPLTQALAAADSAPSFTPDEARALQARAAAIGGVAAQASGGVSARLARLRAKAAILRGPLGTEAEIEAMRRALATL